MSDTLTTHVLRAGLALCLGVAASAYAAAPALTKQAFKAEQDKIEAQQAAALKPCARLKDNARDVCEAEAKGEAKAAKARLAARYKPSPDAEREAKEAQANADFSVAKLRCEVARSKPAKESCIRQAKVDREAAVRLAKIEKVGEISEARNKREELKKGQLKARSPEERYAGAKARCTMMGTERDECMEEAKRRFHKI